jgi:hypothetical protein
MGKEKKNSLILEKRKILFSQKKPQFLDWTRFEIVTVARTGKAPYAHA